MTLIPIPLEKHAGGEFGPLRPLVRQYAENGDAFVLKLPFTLEYSLTRWQRLIPLLRIWGYRVPLIGIASVAGAWTVFLAFDRAFWWGFFALVPLILFRRFWLGLLSVLLSGRARMKLFVDEETMTWTGKQRWYSFYLDGFMKMDRFTRSAWTLQHFLGAVIVIPANAMSEEQVRHLRDGVERNPTEDDYRSVIERGRRARYQPRQLPNDEPEQVGWN